MTSESGVYYQLFTFARFRKFEQKDARRQIVDIGDTQGHEGSGEFRGDDTDIEGGEPLFHVDSRKARKSAVIEQEVDLPQ